MPSCSRTRTTSPSSLRFCCQLPAALCGRFAFRGSSLRGMELHPAHADEADRRLGGVVSALARNRKREFRRAGRNRNGRSLRARASVACALRRLGHDVWRPKKFAQIRAFGLVRRRNERAAAMSEMLPFTLGQASHRRASATRIANGYPPTPTSGRKKTALNAAFLNAVSPRRESRCACLGATRGNSPSRRRDGGWGGPENNFAKLLTH